MTRPITAALFAIAVTAPFGTSSANERSPLPAVSTLPTNVVQVSPSIPMMGEHWADPATLPLGPIYCVHNGEIICLEYMIAQYDFAAGKSWENLAGHIDLPSIDHINIDFEPQGHEGFSVPHYDVHIYFIPAAEVAAIK